MKKQKMISGILAGSLVLTFTIAPVYGASLSEQLAESNARKEAAQYQVNKTQTTIYGIEKELENADKEVSKMNTIVGETTAEIEKLETKIVKSQEELTIAESKQLEQEGAMSDRVRTMYMYGNSSIMEFLFSSKDFSDFATKLNMSRYIIEADKESLKALEETKTMIDEKKKTIEADRLKTVEKKSTQESALTEQENIKAQKDQLLSENQVLIAQYKAVEDAEAVTSQEIETQLQAYYAEQARLAAEKAAAEEATKAAAAQAAARSATQAAAAQATKDAEVNASNNESTAENKNIGSSTPEATPEVASESETPEPEAPSEAAPEPEAPPEEVAPTPEVSPELAPEPEAPPEEVAPAPEAPPEVEPTPEAPVTTDGYQWPCGGSITSPYGYRDHPIDGDYRFHTGVDIGASTGTAVVSAGNGQVISSGDNGGYGTCVIVDLGDGLSALYAHLSSANVSEGEYVTAGQVVGEVGNTGNSTGPHLHFEMRVYGSHVNPYNYF